MTLDREVEAAMVDKNRIGDVVRVVVRCKDGTDHKIYFDVRPRRRTWPMDWIYAAALDVKTSCGPHTVLIDISRSEGDLP